jgi:hypothetical protein
MDIEEIISKLKTEICEVVFEKRDGSERTMICTLKPDLLPYVSVQDMRESVRANDYLPVYDIEEQAWRAFKPSKIIKFESSPE